MLKLLFNIDPNSMTTYSTLSMSISEATAHTKYGSLQQMDNKLIPKSINVVVVVWFQVVLLVVGVVMSRWRFLPLMRTEMIRLEVMVNKMHGVSENTNLYKV